MKNFRSGSALIFALTIAAAAPLALPSSAQAQSMADRLKAKAKARADAAADRTMDKGLDQVENAVKCVATDAACIKKAQDAGKPVTVTNAKGEKVSTADSAKAVSATKSAASAPASAPAASAMDGVNVNFDFIPGDKVIFYEDFATDHVGDLPARLDVTDGNFAIVDKGGRHALMSHSGGVIMLKLPTVLPDRYTIEAEYRLPIATNSLRWTLDKDNRITLTCGNSKTGLYLGDGEKSSSSESGTEPQIALCRYMVDKGYGKAYFGGVRTAQLNGLPVTRSNTLKIEVPGTDENDPFMLYSIRIAAGGKPLWDAISASGRVSVNGILFDTGSDHIRAESTPTLKEIGDLMRDHADLKLLVEGHTDNVGAAAANLSLSDRRAASVKAWLVSKEAVNAARLTTKGMGDTKPAGPNTSPEGRQNNRRVELVKQP
jgi:OOP family OmpA-OmpF porin